jgi:hypothetical protein
MSCRASPTGVANSILDFHEPGTRPEVRKTKIVIGAPRTIIEHALRGNK